jgi:hypothetical protein
VSDRNVLLERYVAALELKDEPAALSYMDFRNQESLRAWRQRRAAGGLSRCCQPILAIASVARRWRLGCQRARMPL